MHANRLSYLYTTSNTGGKNDWRCSHSNFTWGVGITTINIRKYHFILMLRQWAKKLIERFYRRKKFQITLTRKLTSNQLIEDQTDQEYQQYFKRLQLATIEHWLVHLAKRSDEKKICILIWSCSLTRAIQQLIGNQTVKELFQILKRVLVRQREAAGAYSNNANVFKVATNWFPLNHDRVEIWQD